MADNKRVPSRRTKSVKDTTHEPAAARKSRLVDRKKDIHEEIHRLECLITAAPRVAKQHRLARMNFVPPHETETPAYRRKQGDRLPLQQQIALKRQRVRLVTELGLIGIGIVGIVGWLNHFLHISR